EALNGRYDRHIVREALVRDIARVLSRSSKANPVLVGEAGVGKTALVEVLARQLAHDPQPAVLQGIRLVELPVSSIVAGSSLRGSLEQRVNQILEELRSRPDIIVFIDEIHILLAGQAEQTIADILKPPLARGEIRVIGATTPAEYDRTIRADAAMDRRMTPVRVAEPTADETGRLLLHLAPGLAAHHLVRIEQAAIDAAVALSIAYQRDRRLPDKAIDLLEDACARAVITDDGLADLSGEPPLVTTGIVAAAIAARTGIPLHHLTQPAGGLSRDIEQDLRAAVVGQDQAVAAVAATVRLARLGLRPEERPRGVFLFGGPSGVGKTALARALATAMTGSEAALLRIDLSEYQESHAVARLIGSPPGYVGHDSGGQLTGWLGREPSSVVLLDEFEKAHPRVLDLFLQVFDAGRLTDGMGRTVDARHAWFILTTNIPIDQDLAALRAAVRPEFLNRLDHVLAFEPLQMPALLDIAEREIATLRRRLGLRVHELRVEPLAVVSLCHDEEDGRPANGRTVLRAIEARITTPLALLLDAHAGPPPVVLVEPVGQSVAVSLAAGPSPAVAEPGPPIAPTSAAEPGHRRPARETWLPASPPEPYPDPDSPFGPQDPPPDDEPPF
ncbi:MAG: AAA family ATPase, partial [Chloroflexota bacterium]